MDIWVETWNAAPWRRQIDMTPQSETMNASTNGLAYATMRSISSASSSNMIALSVRYALTPAARHRAATSGRSASQKFTPLRARMLKVPSPK